MSAPRLRAVLAGAALALGGCAAPLPPPTLYALESTPLAAAAGAPFRGTVAIGPTSVAELIDRSQIVQRTAPNRIEVLDAHRWAEPLRAAVPRVLAAQLAARLGEPRVAVAPQLLARPEYRITLDVARLEYGPAGEARLEILWTVRRTRDGAAKSGRSAEREAPTAPGIEFYVAAQGRAIARAAAEIEAALREVAGR